METTPKQHMILIVLGGVIFAAVAVGVVMYFISSSNRTVVQAPAAEEGEVLEEPVPVNFDTSLLERAEYKNLDMSLFARGLLPVTPPGGTGKTNIFR